MWSVSSVAGTVADGGMVSESSVCRVFWGEVGGVEVEGEAKPRRAIVKVALSLALSLLCSILLTLPRSSLCGRASGIGGVLDWVGKVPK